jgi:hypothetical protein
MLGFLRRRCCEDKVDHTVADKLSELQSVHHQAYVKPKPVDCEECGCVVAADRAKKVTWRSGYTFSRTLYYCTRCAPPYDEAQPGGVYLRNVPASQIEVTAAARAKGA